MRLEQFLAAHALRTPSKPAIVVGEQRLAYDALLHRARALAAGLGHAGVVPGDRIVVYLPNGVEFVQILYAAFLAGAIVVPVNTRHTPRELAYFVQDSRARVLVLHADSAAAIDTQADGLHGVRRVVVGGPPQAADAFEALGRDAAAPLPDLALSGDDALILYTSGTTGKPKGAVLTHANLIVGAYANASGWQIGADDRFLITTPLAHRTGFARLMNTMQLGATLFALPRFDAQAAIDTIAREGISVIGMVPTVARMLLATLPGQTGRCASLRQAIVTGEAFPLEVKSRLVDLLPQLRLHSFFGMTEVGQVTVLEHETQFTHPASVGRVLPGVEVRLVGDDGQVVALGEVGEILVRSGEPGRFTIMRGYFDKPEATAATLRQGWVHTGDLGRFDAEGYLYIVDRKKDMVLSGGFNIYTKEVEQVLAEHADVADAAVIGVPDAIFGEAVAAFVERRAGARVDAQAIQAFSKSRIASYKKPKHVFFLDTLPRNSAGKVLKAELREHARSLLARADAQPAGTAA